MLRSGVRRMLAFPSDFISLPGYVLHRIWPRRLIGRPPFVFEEWDSMVVSRLGFFPAS
jgi:hypothetical protein